MVKFKFRKYQDECVNIGEEYMNRAGIQKPALIVAPVAAGKSLLIAEIVRRTKGAVLVLQPSKELLLQNYEKFTFFGGEAGIYSASANSKEIEHVTYATLGSIKKDVAKLKELGVTNIIMDEAHTSYSPDEGSMFSMFIEELQPTHVLGFTATPIRLKTVEGIAQLNMLTRMRPKFFHHILNVVSIKEMVDNGFWADLEYEEHEFQSDVLKLNTTGSEFTSASIQRAISKAKVEANLRIRVSELIEEDKKGVLVFCESVALAETLVEEFGELTATVTAKTKTKDRDRIIKDFKSDKIKVVFNVQTLTAGFDHPELDTVILAKPTNSLALYYQMVGRGCRIHPDKKNCLVIDYCGNVERFGHLEDLVIEDIDGWGWGMHYKGMLLTNIPFGSNVSIDYLKKKAELKSQNLEYYRLTFGKHKGQKLSETPIPYRSWMLKNIETMHFSGISKTALKNQLIDGINNEAELIKDPTKVILIDLNNISFILFAQKRLNLSGVKEYMHELGEKYGTDEIKLIADAPKYTYWRKKIYPEYKENRKKLDLDPKFFLGMDSIKESDIVLMKEGMEADDLIAQYARSGKYKQVYIVSKDGDFPQLCFFKSTVIVDPKTKQSNTISKKEALKVLITKVLKGDAKDNIKKCHLHKQIRQDKVDLMTNKAMEKVIEYVTSKEKVKASEIPLKLIILECMQELVDIDLEKFELNYRLIDLIQDQR